MYFGDELPAGECYSLKYIFMVNFFGAEFFMVDSPLRRADFSSYSFVVRIRMSFSPAGFCICV
ncbi:hypothetical protein ES15_2199 [Cronobacter sakazakii ES15]|nr:hypothetical protein ES15_2199 [Cronobacter sakazakii ES15]